ncbi:hypothetical protein THIOM_002451 [Candidatus Thiomargarita nelsonii]|uniref:Uncharacterized protein n=1 Tax=Candidatus Thiomargarita nelsonii TaxID=1003181 RepID=A0A176S1G0_9GAMM|nr:hypothetical protein THIOM_002451 [Candidatus Thiomargarita nelsonii]
MGTEFGLEYAYVAEYGGKTGKAHSAMFSVGHSLDNGIGFGGYVGRQNFDKNDEVGLDDYTYYGVSLSYTVADFTLSVDFSDTDLDNPDNSADERVFFTLKKDF